MLNTLKTGTPGAGDLLLHVYTKKSSILGSITLDICNKIFCQGKFPTKLKTEKVIPKHKNGDKEALWDYRPISLIKRFIK